MSNLVLRSTKPKPILTRALRRKDRITAIERLRIYYPAIMWPTALLFIVICGFSVHKDENNTAPILGIVFWSCWLIWNTAWLVAIGDSTEDAMGWKDRKWNVIAERLRKSRAHRDEEKSRLHALRHGYDRYSVDVTHSGESVRLLIVAHSYIGPTWWWLPIDPAIRWHARKTKMGVGRSGTWSEKAIALVEIDHPTTDKVLEGLAELQVTAAGLEAHSYAKALKEHSAYAVVVAAMPPPSGPRLRRKVDDRAREHMESVAERAKLAGHVVPNEGVTE